MQLPSAVQSVPPNESGRIRDFADALMAHAASGFSGRMVVRIATSEGEVRVAHGRLVYASLGVALGEEALTRILLADEGAFVVEERQYSQSDSMPTIESALTAAKNEADILRESASSAGGLSRAWTVRFRALDQALKEIPREVSPLLRLLDGTRSIRDLFVVSPLPPRVTVRVISRLLGMGILVLPDAALGDSIAGEESAKNAAAKSAKTDAASAQQAKDAAAAAQKAKDAAAAEQAKDAAAAAQQAKDAAAAQEAKDAAAAQEAKDAAAAVQKAKDAAAAAQKAKDDDAAAQKAKDDAAAQQAKDVAAAAQKAKDDAAAQQAKDAAASAQKAKDAAAAAQKAKDDAVAQQAKDAAAAAQKAKDAAAAQQAKDVAAAAQKANADDAATAKNAIDATASAEQDGPSSKPRPLPDPEVSETPAPDEDIEVNRWSSPKEKPKPPPLDAMTEDDGLPSAEALTAAANLLPSKSDVDAIDAWLGNEKDFFRTTVKDIQRKEAHDVKPTDEPEIFWKLVVGISIAVIVLALIAAFTVDWEKGGGFGKKSPSKIQSTTNVDNVKKIAAPKNTLAPATVTRAKESAAALDATGNAPAKKNEPAIEMPAGTGAESSSGGLKSGSESSSVPAVDPAKNGGASTTASPAKNVEPAKAPAPATKTEPPN